MTAARADSCSLRAAGEAIAVALVPLVAYWQTIFHDYAFRDDYAHLREVHESPGSLVLFTAAHGRPLYGVLLEGSIAPLHLVADLPWLRLLAAALVIATALVLAREMRRQGWSGTEAAAAGTALTLLPATQMTVGWAIAWPNAAALLLGICGFVLLDRALHGARWKAVPACAAYFASGLIYPSNALFAVVPLATALLVRAHKTPVRTALLHLGALFGSVGAGFVLMKAMFAAGVLLPAARLHFESDIVGKLLWFLGQPVPNALALFALRDRFGTGATLFASCAVGVALLIVIGLTVAVRRKLVPAGTVACCVLALPVAAHAVSLAAGDRAIGYRTTFALAGLVVVLAVFALRALCTARWLPASAAHAVLAAGVAAAAVAAHEHSYRLIAEPQGREWRMVRDFVAQLPVQPGIRIYVVQPRLEHRSTERVFADEFGSLSADSDWVPREMIRTALRERLGAGTPPYTLDFGDEPPASGAYDFVLDMRMLERHRHRLAGGG